MKLLNFLVQNVDARTLQHEHDQNIHSAGLSYALGVDTFVLPNNTQDTNTCRVVKLADFGTSFFDGAECHDPSAEFNDSTVIKPGRAAQQPH